MSISKISYVNNVTLITLAALPCDSAAVANVLTSFSEGQVNVDMISQTAPQGGEIRLSFTVSDEALADVLTILGKLRREQPSLKPEILPGNSKIAFYDADMVNTPGVAAKVFTVLSKAGIQIELITTSDVDISLLVPTHAVHDALALVEEAYGVSPVETSF
jgi:aspartate kinase